MSDRPILMKAHEVRALLDGRKTQTRRIIKSRGELPDFCGGRGDAHNDPESYGWEDYERGGWITLDQFRHWNFVPFAVDDRLWAKETWRTAAQDDALPPSAIKPERASIGYEADCAANQIPATGRKRPSIHMPRWASRLTLTVTDVRVQRLQDISEADAIAEGVERDSDGWQDYLMPTTQCCTTAGESFKTLWNSTNGPDAWVANPWVVALTFDVHRCNIDAQS